MNNQNKNTFLAIALSVLVLIGWQFLYVNPKLEQERKRAEIEAQLQESQAPDPATNTQPAQDAPVASGDVPAPAAGSSDGVPGSAVQAPAAATREAALASSQRIQFSNGRVTGSINLTGARVDDLHLDDYKVTIEKDSPAVTLLSPAGIEDGYFAEFGYSAAGNSGSVPGPDTVWKSTGNASLTPESPVTLEWTNDKGVSFRRIITLDDEYMFTYSDEIVNGSGEAITVYPYGRVTRFNRPNTQSIYVLHEGMVGVFGADGLQEYTYKKIAEDKSWKGDAKTYTGGWAGITDKYWAATVIPGFEFSPEFSYSDTGRPRYQSDYLGTAMTVQPGATLPVEQKLFAGAKVVQVIDRYDAEQNILNFDLLIDWGWFYFITKPLFKMLDWIYSMIGNFGVAILIGTVIIKGALFPLANMSYASMAKMKKVQPEMQRIKEQFGDDRVKQQQAMMELYKKEKINPAAGCWPMLVQIPIFFALYKVIYVTIEMRHAPFFGWIQDLSAPDPTSILNLFGLLPYDSPAALAILAIGVWPLIMGITMFVQMQMNPAPPDPTQQMIFKWMPIMFTFMLAKFPAGLVIYWAWNNTLSIIQQGLIMKRHGAKIELWDNLKGLFSRKKKSEPTGK